MKIVVRIEEKMEGINRLRVDMKRRRKRKRKRRREMLRERYSVFRLKMGQVGIYNEGLKL